jgi:hypothetical protein
MQLNGRHVALYTTIVLYLGSLLLPGLVQTYEGGSTSIQYGYEILMLGLLGIFVGLLPCYGYVLGIIGFIALRLKKTTFALICSVLGLLLGLQALYLQMVNAQINFIDSYNSWERGMGELSIGYYVWLSTLGLLIVQCIIAFLGTSKVVSPSLPRS